MRAISCWRRLSPTYARRMRIVLLHALPLDARMWGADIANLGGDVLAPDLFRLGESIEDWAAVVIEMIGADDVVVVGCSVGGSCALEVARAAPERVRGIVLVGAKADVRPE